MSLLKKDMVLSTEQAIKYLKISSPTYVKYILEGRIRAVKAGYGWKVLLSELNRFLTGGPIPDQRTNRKRKARKTK